MKKPALLFLFLLLCFVVTACTYPIEITMTMENAVPVFHFKFKHQPNKPVTLSSISIRKSEGRDLVWDIATCDYSVLYKLEGGKLRLRYLNKSELPEGYFRKIEVPDLPFGTVPEGFEQFYPVNKEEKPALQPNTRYTIYVFGRGGSGWLTFTIPE